MVPYLAKTYFEPISTQTTRDNIEIVFQAFHRYAGMAVGEHLGYLCISPWTAFIALTIAQSPQSNSWASMSLTFERTKQLQGVYWVGNDIQAAPIQLATHVLLGSFQKCIFMRMSETYQSKRERWQRLLDSLPADLREHVSLRNVEAVVALNSQAQTRLTEAIQAGLKRMPRAIEQLRIKPDTSVTELLNPPTPAVLTQSADIPQHIQKELTDLIQLCFPDMPGISAEALASADVMEVARIIAQAHTQLFNSKHLRTDFVVLVLYGLMRQSLERLEEVIEQSPALQLAFSQSPLPWKPNDWRNKNA